MHVRRCTNVFALVLMLTSANACGDRQPRPGTVLDEAMQAKRTVDTFPAASGTPALKRIPVTAAQLGTNEMAELRVEVDRTFVPAKLPAGGRDVRELGIRVYNVFVETR